MNAPRENGSLLVLEFTQAQAVFYTAILCMTMTGCFILGVSISRLEEPVDASEPGSDPDSPPEFAPPSDEGVRYEQDYRHEFPDDLEAEGEEFVDGSKMASHLFPWWMKYDIQGNMFVLFANEQGLEPVSAGRAILNPGEYSMKTVLNIDRAQLGSFCARWHIRELELFGSALRDDFGPESDVDLLATYEPGAKITLFDEAQMQEELESLLGRRVDLLSRRAVEESTNSIRREAILNSTEPFYVAQ